MKNIAIITPLNNAYSETFIQAHKNKLKGNIKFYFDGVPPKKLEGIGYIKSNFINELFYRMLAKLKNDNDLLFTLRFKKSLKDKKINIVLAEYGTTGVGVLPVCKELNIPLVVHFHGADASVHAVIDENRESYKAVFNYARWIIVVSKVMEQKILDLGAPKEKVILNTYGPNELFNAIVPTFKEKRLIGIGRFVDKKAPYYTILAFKQALNKHPDAKLALAGDGPLLNTCTNLVQHLGIANNVHFLGVITPDQFKEELTNARAFVQHSVTAENGDMEGTPLAILESSSAGLPVISTNHAGIPDVIINNETGLLVDEHDVEGMSINMIKILDDIELAKKLGANGKKRVQEFFSMQRNISKINELMNSI